MASAILYGTDWCAACAKAEAHLRKRVVNLVKKDVENDAAARAEMFQKQLTSPAADTQDIIPVIDLDGQILLGFSAQQIDQALGLASPGQPTGKPDGMPNKKPSAPFDLNPFDDAGGFGAGLLGGGLGMGLVVLAVLWALGKGGRRG